MKHNSVVFIQGREVKSAESNTTAKKKKGKASSKGNPSEKARISREAKLVPSAVFVIEQFERYLIQLSKKSNVREKSYFNYSGDIFLMKSIIFRRSISSSTSR
jgi:Fanconi anemia group I protein